MLREYVACIAQERAPTAEPIEAARIVSHLLAYRSSSNLLTSPPEMCPCASTLFMGTSPSWKKSDTSAAVSTNARWVLRISLLWNNEGAGSSFAQVTS